jgi:hypothetical protein
MVTSNVKVVKVDSKEGRMESSEDVLKMMFLADNNVWLSNEGKRLVRILLKEVNR